MCSKRPFSVGRLSVKPAPKGVTLISLVSSIHSKSRVSRPCTRTGSFNSNRSRISLPVSVFTHLWFKLRASQKPLGVEFSAGTSASRQSGNQRSLKPLILLEFPSIQQFAKKAEKG